MDVAGTTSIPWAAIGPIALVLLAFVVYSVLMLSGTLFQAVYKYHQFGLPLLAGLLPNLMPQVISYTLPISALAAAVFAFGRLSADNEVQAMQEY